MKTIIFGPWVGEFSYEVQWWIPELRQIASETKCKVIIVGYPGREALYRDFMDEYISLPKELLSLCDNPNCWGQRKKNSQELYIPEQILEYCNQICNQYSNSYIHLPGDRLIGRRYLDNPYGLYKNLDLYDSSVNEFINSLLYKFTNKNTICIIPKLRKRNGIDIDHETWPVETWEHIVNVLINDLNLNVISFLFKVNDTSPGTHDLNHLSLKYINKFTQVDLKCEKSLDIQIGLLKNTLCSLYGSTGAAILPIVCNTKMITFQTKEAGWRLNFKWQRQLTNNHKFICIQDTHTANKFKSMNIGIISEVIKSYIKSILPEVI